MSLDMQPHYTRISAENWFVKGEIVELTQEERAILAHVVLDPDVWVTHALATVGEKAVTAKIERWRPVYLAEKDNPDYKNRIQRDAAEKASRQPTPEQIEKATVETLIQATIREQAITALVAEGKLDQDGKMVK
jgi:hypothetical protein